MNSGDTAWILISAALVLLMTPGLALFYGGMVRSRSVLNMLMMSLGSMAVVGVLWVLFGYSLAFGNDMGGGLLGSPTEFLGMSGLIGPHQLSGTIPTLAFAAFQAMFAILTVALISGAIADRARFVPWLLFAAIWATAVYFPVAHWVFAFDQTDAATGAVATVGGWIANQLAAVDFAGGTAVHINAGAAGLALALVLGRRTGWPRDTGKPHNLPLVVLGAGLLWFGWFGFNAGSALKADDTAALVLFNSLVATSASMLVWLLVERIRDGRPTTLGAASSVIAGLVGITPACSSVTPLGALGVGAMTGLLCALAVSLKHRFGYDDSLDVVAVHLVGGLAGTLLVGVFASSSAPAEVNGLLYGGGFDQLWRQAVGAGAVLAYSFLASLVIALIVKALVGFRARPEDELVGIDEAEHAEIGYSFADHADHARGAPDVQQAGSTQALLNEESTLAGTRG